MIDVTRLTIKTDLAAKIFIKWAEEEKVPLTSIRSQTGYSYDIINNVFHAKNKDVSLERVGRISLVLGHSLEEFCELAFDNDEEILCDLFPSRRKLRELEEKMRELDQSALSVMPNNGQTLVQTQVYAEKTIQVSETSHSSHIYGEDFEAHILERFRRVRDESEKRLEEGYKGQIHEIKELGREKEAHLNSKYEEMKAMYERVIKRQEEAIKSQRKRIYWALGALIFVTVLYAGQWVFDALNPYVGFLRSLFSPLSGQGNNLFS